MATTASDLDDIMRIGALAAGVWVPAALLAVRGATPLEEAAVREGPTRSGAGRDVARKA
ncbi:hypothetical protein ACWGJB_41235 [Streptomyces sp. NPDC054813]